jgi:predicted membrane channel-forming protein YqfA (hemolysin III family)
MQRHSSKKICWFLAISSALLIFILFCLPPIPQPESYHDFGDKRIFWGIPNAYNVLSNLPILLFSFVGIVLLLKKRVKRADKQQRGLWFIFFGSMAMVSIFSAFYHLKPNNFRLVFDRLAISWAVMSFFLAVLNDYLNKLSTILIVSLYGLATSSVFYWLLSEMHLQGDLRFYGYIQFVPIILVLGLAIFFPKEKRDYSLILLAFLMYFFAKIAEQYDIQIFYGLKGMLSGHTLKHLLSALGLLFLVFFAYKKRD